MNEAYLRWRPLALLTFLIAIACTALAQPQHAFKLPSVNRSSSGQLHRFFANDSSYTLHDVLQVAMRENLDIWQVTRSHLDVYTSSSSSFSKLPVELARIPHYTSNDIPMYDWDSKDTLATRSSSPKEWEVGSFENSTFHDVYHPLSEIEGFLHDLAGLHPQQTRVVKLGHSGEGREMYGLTISSGEGGLVRPRRSRNIADERKLGFVIVGAQHAREWVATATALHLAHALLADSSEPHSLSSLLDHFDFHIIPSPNPDGYDYTWESDRYWYKTRQVVSATSQCVGVDMNRNWGYKWKPTADEFFQEVKSTKKKGKKEKTPTDPCSHWYPGQWAFQSPEANNIANFVMTLPNLAAFVDLRSYGQMVSSPYSYTCKRLPKDAEDQIEAAMGAAQASTHTHGATFVTGSLCSMLYKAPGNIVDWMYARAEIKYSYVVHLRDTGTYGFSLPSRWIRPVGEETGSLVRYLGKFITKQLKL